MGNHLHQKCWKCKKAVGGCSWSDSGIPIKNWVAKRSVIEENEGNMESYKIISCPEFEKDEPRESVSEKAWLDIIKLAKKLVGVI